MTAAILRKSGELPLMSTSCLGCRFAVLMSSCRLSTGNISWRLEENVYSDRYLANRNDYDEYLLSVRFGVDYIVNRYLSLYANFTWEENWCESHSNYNYDRFRGTVGMKFHY